MLSCVNAAHFVDWNPAKPGTNTSALKVDSITLGDPDPALFSVPVGYSEMLPSIAMEQRLRASNIPEAAVQKIVAGYKTTEDLGGHPKPANEGQLKTGQ